MSSKQHRAVIIGAGIVGLHIACKLLDKGFSVFVLEQEPYLAEHTSGRNSGVIHAGIYYNAGSLKERLCLRGNTLTYEWATKLNIPHKRCGKWVLANKKTANELGAFLQKLHNLGFTECHLTSAEELKKLEPQLIAQEALNIQTTGIIDAATYVKTLSAYVEAKGGTVIKNCLVQECLNQKLKTSRGDMPFDLAINSAGLNADTIAHMSGLTGYTTKPCRGDYYVYPQKLLNRPVYHIPQEQATGLGIHLTPTLDDQTLIGPNAFFIADKTDYQHHSDATEFLTTLKEHINLPSNHKPIQKAYSGNRPKLYYNGEAVRDFTLIKKGCWIHLLGIESPGLTAAPALAEEVFKNHCI